jgi:hypothetical protein
MAYQSTTKYVHGSRLFLGSIQFITDKFGDLTLQEPESRKINRSGTGCLPPAPVRVDLINEAQLRHGLSELGKPDSDPTGDKVDHTRAAPTATIDSICQSPPRSDSKGDREVYMVGNREELPNKSIEEIQWEHGGERSQTERGTTASRMTRVCRKMSLGMALLRGDTTRSSIHDAMQNEIDFGTGHDQSMRKSVRSSIRGSRSTTLQCRMP